jgi:hypothetical protein
MGPGGTPVFLTHATVQKPLHPCDDGDALRLLEDWCLKETQQPWSLTHPPQTAWVVLVHVFFMVLLFALATAYQRPCEQANRGGEPLGWQRQLLEQARDHDIVLAQDAYSIFHLAKYSLLFGVRRKDVPPGIGTRQEILPQYGLTIHD